MTTKNATTKATSYQLVIKHLKDHTDECGELGGHLLEDALTNTKGKGKFILEGNLLDGVLMLVAYLDGVDGTKRGFHATGEPYPVSDPQWYDFAYNWRVQRWCDKSPDITRQLALSAAKALIDGRGNNTEADADRMLQWLEATSLKGVKARKAAEALLLAQVEPSTLEIGSVVQNIITVS